MSPLSDTTVMAPGLSGARLIPHIRHMLWTTVPAICVTAVIFTVMGLGYHLDDAGIARLATISAGLRDAFSIGWVPLIPPVLVLALLVKRVEAFPAIMIGALAGVVVAVTRQGADTTTALTALWSGYTAPASLGDISGLLSGGETGGALKMLGLGSIVLFALAIAGVLSAAGVMESLLEAVTPRLDTPRKLIPATLGITLALNMIGGAVNFAVAMGATFMRPLYERMGLAPENLSRAVEDSGTTTGPLIPWNATAVFTAGALGVSAGSFVPYLFFCFLTPLTSLIYGLTGFTILGGDAPAAAACALSSLPPTPGRTPELPPSREQTS
jgi:Na+:H+ antiporter, NhaC family